MASQEPRLHDTSTTHVPVEWSGMCSISICSVCQPGMFGTLHVWCLLSLPRWFLKGSQLSTAHEDAKRPFRWSQSALALRSAPSTV